MNDGVTQDDNKSVDGAQNIMNTDSAENFQQCIYELFEKNGVLNDLRSYLRRHIVDVLKSAQTGDLSTCHKHFTQRLELTFQAVNILIAEYLLRLEINYTLSVFVTEIPLANMVFGFAKSLMESNTQNVSEICFTDNDVWSILNYLGIQCDSEHASKIIDMYRKSEQCLLLCILQCLPMYQNPMLERTHAALSDENSSSCRSSDIMIRNGEVKDHKQTFVREKCRHIATCKTCKATISKMKEKYKKKGKQLSKRDTDSKYFNVDMILKNVGVMERTIIDEMFQQLKSVYETEVEMVKAEEENKLRRSVASHVLQFQQQREELERSFKARQAELEQNVANKKRFLWGLARALREQLQHLGSAMHEVRVESKRLAEKEAIIKTQLVEAEQVLKNRAEEMRAQISQELNTLEIHLATIKSERDSINKERSALKSLKHIEDNISKVDTERDEMRSRYDLIKNELLTLKQSIGIAKMNPKCVTEKATLTDLRNIHSNLNVSLNNSHNVEKTKCDDFDDRLKNQVVNDFKKKNVNFSQANFDELYRERSYVKSQSSESSEAGDSAHLSQAHHSKDVDRDIVNRLKEENSRLKECARQQQSQLAALSRRVAGACACESLRARTADPSGPSTVSTPTPCQPQFFLHGVNTCASANTVNMSWYKGAGEELSMFNDAQPSILVPGDSIPFVGVLRDRHVSRRRQILNQWRALRSRQFQVPRLIKRPISPVKDRPGSSGQQSRIVTQLQGSRPGCSMREKVQPRPKTAALVISKKREKSPKSVLREAKEKLRNIKDLTVVDREKNPNSVLHEAKLRLRKLEIEAEAVERSYLDFRRRQSELKLERNSHSLQQHDALKIMEPVRDIDTRRSHSSVHKQKVTSTDEVDIPITGYQLSLKNDFDKYLREYQTNLEINKLNQPTAEKIKPIPGSYIKENNIERNNDYLETPMTEFRKLYHSVRQSNENGQVISFVNCIDTKIPENGNQEQKEKDDNSRAQSPAFSKIDNESEFTILEENINKMYNLSIEDIERESEKSDNSKLNNIPNEDKNLLRVEVESVNGIKSGAEEILLVVQNTIDLQGMKINEVPNGNIGGQVTVIVSPKEVYRQDIEDIDVHVDLQPPETVQRSSSPEQKANITRNDVLEAIFNAEVNDLLNESISKMSSSGSERQRDDDDFSADVDNYNSGLNSPLSLHKASEDENLW